MEDAPFISRPSVFDKDRVVTNRVTLRIFTFCSLMWLACSLLAAYESIAGSKLNGNEPNSEQRQTVYDALFSTDFGLCCFIAILLTIVLLAAIRHIPRFCCVVFVTFWIPMFFNTQLFKSNPSFMTGLAMIAPYLSCAFTLYLLNTEWLHLPDRILKESCKVFTFFKSSIVFVILLNIVCLFIVYVTSVTTVYIVILKLPEVLIILNIIIAAWAILIISCIGYMSLSATYATSFWTENKSSNNGSLCLRSFKLMCKYHIGTAAYATSPIGILNTIYKQIVHACRKYNEDPSASLIIFFIYNFLDCVVMKIAFLGATVKCAINGTNYQDSMDQVLEDLKKHPKRCFVVTKVLEYVATFISVISIVVMFYFARSVMEKPVDGADYPVRFICLLTGSLMLILPIFWMLITAAYTILFCVIEDLSIHNGSHERPYAMSDKLQKALNHNGAPSCLGLYAIICLGIAQLWFFFLWV